MTFEKDSLIIIVSAPSGSGKTTLVERVLQQLGGIRRSISCTTRQPRQGEQDKQDYIFIPEEDFKKKIEDGEFLEWEENFGNYYGTDAEQVDKARAASEDIVLSIDIKGARKIKKDFPESISVFIMPPSTKELRARLEKRNTDHAEQVSLRLKEAEREIAAADEYDFLIVNEELEKAVEELKEIIVNEKKNRSKINKKETE